MFLIFRHLFMTRIPLLLLLFLAAPLHAQTMGDPTSPSFGGLGSVSGGVTNRGTYLGGTPTGAFQNSQFGLRASVPYGDRLAVSALVNWREEGQNQGAPRADLTYLFATYRLSRAWDLRLGKVKNPNNLYSEVFDIGTLRPFLTLPQGIYGGTANAFTSYTGAGVNGTAFLGDWQLGVAGYVSGGYFRYNSTRLALGPGGNGEREINIRSSAGGRLMLRPPVQGLAFGVSGTTARIGLCVEERLGAPCDNEFSGLQGSAQFEYLTDRLWVRSEFALLDAAGFLKTRGGYAQVAWFLTRKWQVALQYDAIRDEIGAEAANLYTQQALPPGVSLPPGVELPPGGVSQLLPNTLDRHEDWSIGLNYWLAPEVAVKLSVHEVDGWRFARPPSALVLQGVFTGQYPPTRSRLLQAGLQFSF